MSKQYTAEQKAEAAAHIQFSLENIESTRERCLEFGITDLPAVPVMKDGDVVQHRSALFAHHDDLIEKLRAAGYAKNIAKLEAECAVLRADCVASKINPPAAPNRTAADRENYEAMAAHKRKLERLAKSAPALTSAEKVQIEVAREKAIERGQPTPAPKPVAAAAAPAAEAKPAPVAPSPEPANLSADDKIKLRRGQTIAARDNRSFDEKVAAAKAKEI